ncbi:F-box only protein 6-like [Mya arenaria]|uniref:F-box only protein 6-like n=1 Tax=Mya arenaria TaxID=6604 RepID=UPI0022E75187|nr:F-box only protein 6-like [Mya arenaria]
MEVGCSSFNWEISPTVCQMRKSETQNYDTILCLGLSEWQVICNGGVGWSVEANPNGSDPGTVGCWAASFGKCAKYQVVDLMAAGCSKHVLDHFRPAIHVSEWHSGRGNIEAEYNMTVELMSNKGDTFWIAPSGNMRYSVDVTLPAGRSDWHQIKHTFQDYPMGIRFVGFYHSGKNKEYSLMEKGPKMTLASVILDFKHVAGPAESRDDDV